MALADWSQRWFPDAFVFALAGLSSFSRPVILASDAGPRSNISEMCFLEFIPLHDADGDHIIGGYVVARLRRFTKLIRWNREHPAHASRAIAFVAFFSDGDGDDQLGLT